MLLDVGSHINAPVWFCCMASSVFPATGGRQLLLAGIACHLFVFSNLQPESRNQVLQVAAEPRQFTAGARGLVRRGCRLIGYIPDTGNVLIDFLSHRCLLLRCRGNLTVVLFDILNSSGNAFNSRPGRFGALQCV